VTGPDQGPEDEAKRKPSRRVPPNELHAAEDETYQRLLEELETTDRKYARLLDELSLLDDNRRSRGQRAILGQGISVPPSDAVDDRGRPVQVTRGRRASAIAAVLLTVLSISYFVLKSLSSVVPFDIPGRAQLGDLGRQFLPAPLLPFVPVLVPALAWVVWGLVVARQQWRSRELRRGEARTPAGEETPMAPAGPGMTRRLLREMRPYVPSIAMLFLVSLAAVPLTLITPLPIKLLLDNVILSQPLPSYLAFLGRDPSAVPTGTVVALALGILVAGTILTYLQNLANIWSTNRVGNRMTLDMRVRLFRQLQRLSTAYHDTKGTIDSTYRIQNDATALRSLSADGLIPLIAALLTLGGMIVVMASLDWQLALIALIVTPFMFLLTLFYRRRIRAAWRKVKTSESAAMSAAQESLSASRVVKVFGQEERENEQFRSRYTESASAALKAIVEGGIYSLVVGAVTAVGLAAVLFIGVQHVQAGALSPGGLLMINYYLTQLYSPLKDVGKKVLDIQMSMAGMERFLEILDEKVDVPEKVDARPLVRASGNVAFQDVSFGYDESRLVLRHMSFELPAGTCLGVIGPTGSGKTTLANLLVRFFDPTEGAITLEGIDLRDYRIADLRNQFGVVLQDTLLFSTTIAENIRFAKPDATDREIVAAAKLANAHDFIQGLPGGYETQVGERAMKLSGGERQRISLARAFLKNAPILILDEPTSALDLQTEASIIDAIQRLVRGRTTLMIAHRPSTLRACDSLLLLEPNGNSRMTREVGSSLLRMAAVGVEGPGAGLADGGDL